MAKGATPSPPLPARPQVLGFARACKSSWHDLSFSSVQQLLWLRRCNTWKDCYHENPTPPFRYPINLKDPEMTGIWWEQFPPYWIQCWKLLQDGVTSYDIMPYFIQNHHFKNQKILQFVELLSLESAYIDRNLYFCLASQMPPTSSCFIGTVWGFLSLNFRMFLGVPEADTWQNPMANCG